jgi:ABC-type multidrug transport system fused ATPase/permease subunit
MEAKVSVDRIDKYFQSAEKAPHMTDVDYISFDDAKIAWPGDNDVGEERADQLDVESRFVLANLTLRFPPKGLSVIAGKTGSGKSLLLASVLGECDVLGGSVKVPSAPSPDERYDDQATRANWIIDTAVAYVAQNPWIENATIRQNILFGLPFDRRRYRRVLFASGLERDLNMFPDGDVTDIGTNGVNLSGGQRWRISFARALYSRAGILVMDDIFSALDACTGRHVYEHALTGSLGQGRTRILVTHHVGLCLPHTDYCIVLDNGTMKDAGTVESLMDGGSLTHLLQEVTAAEPDDNGDQEVAFKNSSILRHRRSSSIATVSTLNSNSTSLTGNEVSPQKFTSDEKRETGPISLSVYAAYTVRGNRLWLWALALLGYVLYMVLTVGRVSSSSCLAVLSIL